MLAALDDLHRQITQARGEPDGDGAVAAAALAVYALASLGATLATDFEVFLACRLVQALVIAGSRSQVMSLWQVDDEATRDLMTDYYKKLKRGTGRSDEVHRYLHPPAGARERR